MIDLDPRLRRSQWPDASDYWLKSNHWDDAPTPAGRLVPTIALLILTVAWALAVFDKGGRIPLSWHVCLLLTGLVSMLYGLWSARTPSATVGDPRLGGLFLLAPAYVAFQLVPLPIFLVKILSPLRADALERLGPITHAPAFAALSVDPATTGRYLLNILACACVAFVIREITLRLDHSWIPAIPLMAVAAIDAVFGILQNANGDAVLGTYRSKDHFAGLLEMTLPLTVAYALAVIKSRRTGILSMGRTLGACGVLVLATVMAVALLDSLAKAGFLAALGALIVLATLGWAARISGGNRWLAFAALAALFILIFIFLPPDRFVANFAESFQDPTAEGRLPIASDALHLVRAYPFVGSGYGTFETAFQKFQTVLVDLDFEFAHNDYLELFSELGVAGFLVFGALMLRVVVRAIRTATLAHPRLRYLGLGCIGAFAAIAIHSFTDFNLYIPANTMLLSWIVGLAASLPQRSEIEHRPQPNTSSWRKAMQWSVPALGLVLVVYASAWVVLDSKLQSDPQSERAFCGFGICDTDAMLAAETARHDGNVARVPLPILIEALRRDPAAPNRWSDLGDAFLASGNPEGSRYCFSRALSFGPNIPPIGLRAARFYHALGDRKQELELTSRVLGLSILNDSQIFDQYTEEKVTTSEVLTNGLPRTERAGRSYLRYVMSLHDVTDAETVWGWLLPQHFVDEPLTRDYVNFLFQNQEVESAAEAWRNFLGDRGNGYLKSNFVLNGDFESDSSKIPFDWRMESLGTDVEVSFDANVAHTGARSLRVHFGGKENVDYNRTSQTAVVRPGSYRFTAFLRTERITTEQGIAIRIYDPVAPSRVDVRTEGFTGTTDWKKIEKVIRVPEGTKLLTIQIIRQPVAWKFDNKIAGTAWIDTVSLSKVD